MHNRSEREIQSDSSISMPTPGMPPPVVDGKAPSAKKVPRVAVIGVHGVAHHDPGATANAMADLLLAVPTSAHDASRSYSCFHSVGIQVPLQRLHLDPVPKIERESWYAKTLDLLFGFLQETSAEFANRGTRYARARTDDQIVPHGVVGREYMRLLLQGYKGGAEGDAYVTTRLEGNRAVNALGGAAEVHIYEVLWADLAKPTNTLLSFFLSLFQLLFHLGSLSRLAIDSGALEHPGWRWIAFRKVQRYAIRMLQLPIPLLKIILLIALFSCMPALSESTQNKTWVALVLGGVAGLAITFLANRHSTTALTISPWLWALRAIFPAALGVLIAALPLWFHRVECDTLSAFACWLVLGLALLFYVIDKYKNVRKGATFVGWSLFVACFLIFSSYLRLAPAQGRVPQATIWTVEWIVGALRISWMLLFIFAIAALVFGSIAWRSVPRKNTEKRSRARAAVRTARFALAVPTLLFLLVTTLLWAGLFSIARGIHDPIIASVFLTPPPGGKWLPRFNLVPDPKATLAETDRICSPYSNPSCAKTNLVRISFLPDAAYEELGPRNPKGQLSQVVSVPGTSSANSRPDYLEDILVWSAGDGFVGTLLLFMLALFLLFWWALPSVFAERYRLRNEKKPPRPVTNEASVRGGTWLSRGLDATSVITFLFWCAIFLVPPLFLPGVAPWKWITTTNGTAYAVTKWLGSGAAITRWIVKSFAVGGAATAVAIAAKYGSPILGAILDVDTYLRTLPEDATPRAKIAERYVSLLRYIARYKGPDGRGYDSIVIVAHSLGSLISADLMRFLKEVGDPALESIGLAGNSIHHQGGVPIKLLTMGSPIRQLLNRFFPYLYDWVRKEPDNGLRPLPGPTTRPPTISENACPDPSELGLKEWLNVYRSGDYVGRSLWLDEWYRRTDDLSGALYLASGGSRSEACLGAGAHTRYWDDTAPDVSNLLDHLIGA